MTNFEKFKDKILELIDDDKFFTNRVAVDLTTGKPEECGKLNCNNCLFYNNCNERTLLRWLYAENKPNLKPCPFCGKTDTVLVNRDDTQYAVFCSVHKNGCGGASGYYYSEDEAIEKWNQRV